MEPPREKHPRIFENPDWQGWGGGGGFAEILCKSRAHLLFLQELHADKAKTRS